MDANGDAGAAERRRVVADMREVALQRLKTCALCGIKETHDAPNFQVCGNCRAARYCCKDHQVAHWRQHKPACKQRACLHVVPEPL